MSVNKNISKQGLQPGPHHPLRPGHVRYMDPSSCSTLELSLQPDGPTKSTPLNSLLQVPPRRSGRPGGTQRPTRVVSAARARKVGTPEEGNINGL